MIDVDALVADGYVKIEQAAPQTVADAARALLWTQLRLSPDEPDGWSAPVLWTADLTGAGPFGEIVRSAKLVAALDQICGAGGWSPRGSLGNIPVRFPLPPVLDDRGWHIDANTRQSDGTWTVSGRPQTLLLLTLLSEVGSNDAPTRIRAGSHRDVAKILGDQPLDPMAAGPLVARASADRTIVHATGAPGDMYLVHPFTVHAADEHRGATPRFMAQGPIMLTTPLRPGDTSPLGRVF